jgi:ABC-type transport system involved in multi-copper enzyme maturation permease subunit
MKFALVAQNTFRESVRDRVLYNLIFFALLMIGASLLVGQLAIGELAKVIADVGLSAMRFFGMLIAIFIGIQLVYKEIERRTIYSLLAKPLRRSDLVLGKFFGLGLTLGVNASVMLLGTMLAIVFVNGGYSPQVVAVIPAGYLVFLELLVTTAIALTFSTISSPAVSALISVLLYIAGNFSENLREVAALTESPALRWLLAGVHYVLPNLTTFNAIAIASYGQLVSLPRLVAATLYAAVYCAILISIAVLVFERRDFK